MIFYYCLIVNISYRPKMYRFISSLLMKIVVERDGSFFERGDIQRFLSVSSQKQNEQMYDTLSRTSSPDTLNESIQEVKQEKIFNFEKENQRFQNRFESHQSVSFFLLYKKYKINRNLKTF